MGEKKITSADIRLRKERFEARGFAVEQWRDAFEDLDKIVPLVRHLIEFEQCGEGLEAMQAQATLDRILACITEANHELAEEFSFYKYE